MNNHSFLRLPGKFLSIYLLYSIGSFIFNYYSIFSVDYGDFNKDIQHYEFLAFIVFRQIRSILTYSLIFFVIATFFTEKYRLTAPKNASVGTAIGFFYCLLSFLMHKFISPFIYPYLSEFFYDDREMMNMSFTIVFMVINIVMLLLVFRLFKPRTNSIPTDSQFAQENVQKAHATILSCFMLLLLLLPMMFIAPQHYLQVFGWNGSSFGSFENSLLIFGGFLINFILIYKVVSWSTRSCFNGVFNTIRWGALFITVIIALIILSIMGYLVNSFVISIITNLNSVSEMLLYLLILLLVGHLILGLSCCLAVRILFQDSLPPSTGIVS